MNLYNVFCICIDCFGVVQFNIQSFEDKMGCIMVEFLGIKEFECVRKLFQGLVNFEFWEIYNVKEVVFYLQVVDFKFCVVLVYEVIVNDIVVVVDLIVLVVVEVIFDKVVSVVDSFVVVLKGGEKKQQVFFVDLE